MMNGIIIFFGLVVSMIGVLMLLQPRLVLDTAYSVVDQRWLQVVTVAARLVLGSALLAYAEQTRFPLTLQIIGGLVLISGLCLAMLSSLTFHQLLRYLLKRCQHCARWVSLLALGFGLFLVYAIL